MLYRVEQTLRESFLAKSELFEGVLKALFESGHLHHDRRILSQPRSHQKLAEEEDFPKRLDGLIIRA